VFCAIAILRFERENIMKCWSLCALAAILLL